MEDLFKEKPKRFFSNRIDVENHCNVVNSIRGDVIFVPTFYKKGFNLFVIKTYSNVDTREGFL